ncbi:hypothetical protein CH354_10105 [Leptospira levettii]|uniref:hypothetical protein n=1 Tax=Leptospira levettii TaxID=2023178 RepID=UPI000C2A8650|nr:hypothetical protein [Leptospira levettii]PJZ37404.1 hypothetical protein CH354_10105 [Leptospira levettii]
MIQLDSSWKGFRTTLARIKKALDESDSDKEISITIEGDNGIQEYSFETVPTSEAIKEIFAGSKKLIGYVYISDRLRHKQILFEEIQSVSADPTPTKQSEPIANFGNSLESFMAQMKLMMQASDEINRQRTQLLTDSFSQQLNATKVMYDERDKVFTELQRKEIELRIKEVEMSQKKKTELLESVIVGIGSGIKETISWAKENPGDFAEIFSLLRSKPTN